MIARAATTRAQDRLDRPEQDVRDDEPGSRKLLLERVDLADVEVDAVGDRIRPGHLDGDRVVVDRHDRIEAEAGSGDREHPRAAADVEYRSAAFLRREQLDAETGRRMRTGAEGTTGVDHDRPLRIRRSEPRWPEPETTGLDGTVERAPGVLPAVVDGRSLRLAEAIEQGGAVPLVDVDGELDGPTGKGALLDPGRDEVEQLDTPGLDVVVRRPECDTPETHARPSGYVACSYQVPSSRSR